MENKFFINEKDINWEIDEIFLNIEKHKNNYFYENLKELNESSLKKKKQIQKMNNNSIMIRKIQEKMDWKSEEFK